MREGPPPHGKQRTDIPGFQQFTSRASKAYLVGNQRTPMGLPSGEPIVYLDPQQTEVYESDLYTCLSNECRYNGGIWVPVLHHLALCVLLARVHGMPLPIQTLVGMHDLHEAYVKDLPSGLKQLLPEYRAIEDLWEEYVHQAFGIRRPTGRLKEKVRFIDLRALVVEMTWEHFCLKEVVDTQHGPATQAEIEACQEVYGQTDEGRWAIIAEVVPFRRLEKLKAPEVRAL